jgi:hypothetical protein
VFNETGQDIPHFIIEILEEGYSLPTGGKPNVVKTISAFEYFYSHWLRHAEDEKISKMKIHEFRAKFFLYASEMTKCSLKNEKSDKLRNCFNKNPELLVCPGDKNKDIIIYPLFTLLLISRP